jgi:5-formyltetrahydrofolate cyclo-ligase
LHACRSTLEDPLDVVLVPGVAFDRYGGRLGFGGGFYDRFLPTTPALRVGVTYDSCLMDELPCTQSDQRMDWIVTPGGLWQIVAQDLSRH